MPKLTALFMVCAFAATVQIVVEAQGTTQRDRALKRIEVCELSNKVSTSVCKKQKADAQLLADVYRSGDRSVLPALLHLKYMSEFYDEALLADPDTFLTALAGLSQDDRTEVERAMAGGVVKPLEKKRFESVRLALTAIPNASPRHTVAAECLKVVLANNASVFLDYFPAETFASGAARFQVYWYSRDLYSLGEMPLWPHPPSASITYRLTLLGSFSEPQTVILTIASDGSGELKFKRLNTSRDGMEADEASAVSSEQVTKFLENLKQADFWEMPVESARRGHDGADWILEGAKAGTYHVAVRWCPGLGRDPSQSVAFGNAARLLLTFAEQKHNGGC